MMEAVADPNQKDSAESVLRHALARADTSLAGVAPVLAHVLADAPNALFAQSVVARVRAMLTDLARQLVQAAQGDPLAPVEEGLPDRLAASLADCPPLLRHLHSLAMEWYVTEKLVALLGLDPVLSPLVQALVASDDPDMAATAMHLLAAQARFGQKLRRMQIALTELPGDVLHSTLQVLRAHLAVLAQEGSGNDSLAESISARAEARIRGSAIHKAFERFSIDHPEDLPDDAEALFAGLLMAELQLVLIVVLGLLEPVGHLPFQGVRGP